MMNRSIKIPYAIRDFDKLIREGYYYVDRTDRIPLMEQLGSELLFLRPRRFGKSLWLSTLMNYYDVAKADDFDRLFGKLAIGQQPTLLHNQYWVMKWDFSEVLSYGTIEQIEASLHDQINGSIEQFIARYQGAFQYPITLHDSALRSFKSVLAAVQTTPYKLYLFIDEYDNFANEVMMGRQGDNRQRYSALVQGEGMFKTFFKNIKSAGAGEGLDRVFMTGVSPIVLSDVSSGANVTKHVTWHPYLSDLCGFRQEEVRRLVDLISADCALPAAKVAEAMEMLRLFYNGSRFDLRNPAQAQTLYNPTLVFYFLEELQQFSTYPTNMLDSNLASDYNKLVFISSYPTGRDLLLASLNEETTLSVASFDERFGVEEMLQPDKQADRLALLLCYLGAVTVAGQTVDARTILQIPNLVMRKLYAERILELTFPRPADRDTAEAGARLLFAQGEIAPLCAFVEEHYFPLYDNRDYKGFNELTLKTLFLALLHHTNLYIMDSEPALERTYADLTMIIRPEMRHYSVYDLLLEFKYVALNEVRMGEKKLSGQEVQELSHAEVAQLPAVQQKLAEAKTQLHGYQQKLQQKYGAALKLRTYAVVSIGLERLVWVGV